MHVTVKNWNIKDKALTDNQSQCKIPWGKQGLEQLNKDVVLEKWERDIGMEEWDRGVELEELDRDVGLEQ